MSSSRAQERSFGVLKIALMAAVGGCAAPTAEDLATSRQSATSGGTIIFEDTFSPQQPGWSFSSPSAGLLGELNNNANVAGVTLTVTGAPAGAGTLEFDLLSFRSLDDATSCCTDTL